MSYKKLALDILKVHEGYSQTVYECSVGVKTVGYGRNLEHKGLTIKEAEYLLRNDIDEADAWCQEHLVYFDGLSSIRKTVLIDMYVNLGGTGLLNFKKMHKALDRADYIEASIQMLDSRWSKQVGNRSLTLAKLMKEEHI